MSVALFQNVSGFEDTTKTVSFKTLSSYLMHVDNCAAVVVALAFDVS